MIPVDPFVAGVLLVLAFTVGFLIGLPSGDGCQR